MLRGPIPLEDLLIWTPVGDSNNYICILLEDVEVFYKDDNSYVNLLAVNRQRKMYIQGRVMPEPDQMKFVKDKQLTRNFIKEPLEGITTHSTEPMAIWTMMQNKWFEIRPHTNYRPTYDSMMHVIGTFWANDRFVEAGGIKSMARDADLVQSSLAIAISYYMTEVGGSARTLPELMAMLTECRLMLKEECNIARYKGSPLNNWIDRDDQFLATSGPQIAAGARRMLKALRKDSSPMEDVQYDKALATRRYPRGGGRIFDHPVPAARSFLRDSTSFGNGQVKKDDQKEVEEVLAKRVRRAL